MRTIALVGIMVLFFYGTACPGAGFETAGKAGVYTVRAAFDKAEPARGENRMEISITDAGSKPVRNLHVSVEYLMPSLPDRPPMMSYKTVAKLNDDKYVAYLDFTMKGNWRVIVKAASMTEPKQSESITFGLTVR